MLRTSTNFARMGGASLNMLNTVQEPSIATPSELPAGVRGRVYDHEALGADIVHIGRGNFHRAYQSRYLHKLMQQGEALDWAIIGASVWRRRITSR